MVSRADRVDWEAGTHTVRLAVPIDGGRNLGSHTLPAGHSGGAQAAVVVGQSRGKAEPPRAELLRCVHPGSRCHMVQRREARKVFREELTCGPGREGGRMREGTPQGERRPAKLQLAGTMIQAM